MKCRFRLRPTHQYVEGSGSEALVMRTVYGESLANAEVVNLRGQAYRVYDGAGVQTAVAYDFKGGLLAAERQLAVDVTDLENAALALLETEVFQTSSTFDALGRARTQTTPDGTVVRLAYNEAALLESVSANVRGSASETAFVSNVDYDAQGRRSLIAYGNGTETTYAYDEVTQRLTRMRTTDATRTFQDLTYTYDVVGNIVEIGDGAQADVYFGGTVVTARQRYEYDALYRLTDAEGREHIGQHSAQPSEYGANPSAHPQDGTALRAYAEAYVYDVVGNILSMQHGAAGGNWTRRYQYAGDGNRLQATSLPGDAAGQHSATYGHDVHGNMSSMPHLSVVGFNHADQMRSADLGGGGTVYFVYDGAGQRVRKVSVNLAGTQTTERVYLGAYELYRERTGGSIQLERETLHIADDAGRMCDVETRTVESGSAVGTPTTHHRYQYRNHLGSASLELTGSADVISYEEYHPYGTSSYRAVNSSIDVSERTYRYTGKERDEETGLGHHGARYYACWLGRWTASDPIGLGDGVNRYAYVSGRPIRLSDPSGRAGEDPLQEEFDANASALRELDAALTALGNIEDYDSVSGRTAILEVRIATEAAKAETGNLRRETAAAKRARDVSGASPVELGSQNADVNSTSREQSGSRDYSGSAVSAKTGAEFAAGLGTGMLVGAAPGGFTVSLAGEASGASEEYFTRAQRAGAGAGELLWGLGQMAVGMAGEGVGGGLIGAGAATTPTGLGTAPGLAAIAGGSALAVGSAVVIAEGAADAVSGLWTLMSAISGDGPSSGGNPSSQKAAAEGGANATPKIEPGKQGKHVPGHNNYQPGKSIL